MANPIDIYPPGILAVKQSKIDRTKWIWSIYPVNGEPEGYTDNEDDLLLPAYTDDLGNISPELLHKRNHSTAISSIPTGLKTGVRAPDVKMMNIPREKLNKNFYEDAFIEVGEIDPLGTLLERKIHLVGWLGESDGDDYSATLELIPMAQLVNLPAGQRIQEICDVGRLPGETFGRGRCRNQVKLDGPNITDWTRGGKVASIVSYMKFILTPFASAPYAAFPSNFPGSHGILRGMTGANKGVLRDIGTFTASTGEVVLRRPIPVLPAVNDVFEIEAGCDKSLSMCNFWNNRKNRRATGDLLPGRNNIYRVYK